MTDFIPGGRFGDYTIVRKLGAGGMGAVWLLRSSTGAEVAAKILDATTSNEHEARRRFLREAQLAIGVKHPNIVEAYDVGQDPDTGLCYILMEYVSGGTLADRLKANGAMPVREAVSIVRQIAGVLEVAHEKGIVHRDIKPANIMFSADGTPKLADLGIARGGSAGIETTTVTQTGMMIGTPAYMAPEQMLDAHNVDTRADIYSLGIVFYEMLTGERPNKDDTVVQLMAKAISGEPLPDVRTLRPEVSASVAELLNLMTERKPESRISSPKRVVEIAVKIENGSVRIKIASPVSPPTEPKRSPLPWFILGGVALAFAALGLFLRPSHPPAARPQASPPPAEVSVPAPKVVVPVPEMVKQKPETVVPAAKAVEPAPQPVERKVMPGKIIVGCDASSHGNKQVYCTLVGGSVAKLGVGARAVPVLFKLEEKILKKINVLVLSGSFSYFLDQTERRSVEDFLNRGGVVVALSTGFASSWAPAGGAVARWLQTYGAVLYNLPREQGVTAVSCETKPEWKDFADTNCTSYAVCTAEWKPLLVSSADATHVISGVRRVGKGCIVFAPQSYLLPDLRYRPSSRVKFAYPWQEFMSSWLAYEPEPDPDFAGSVLSDAAASDGSGRIRFYSSELSQDELRWLSRLMRDADREIVRQFGAETLSMGLRTNCIVSVGQYSPAYQNRQSTWVRLMAENHCFEFSSGNTSPSRPNGMSDMAFQSLVQAALLPSGCEAVTYDRVLEYMASAVLEGLRTNGYEKVFAMRPSFPQFGNYATPGEACAAARAIDPDFTRYDFFCKPCSAATRKLTDVELRSYGVGRFYAMMNDLRKEHPDVCCRYLSVCRDSASRSVSAREVLDRLCKAYGSDRPRRWPGK